MGGAAAGISYPYLTGPRRASVNRVPGTRASRTVRAREEARSFSPGKEPHCRLMLSSALGHLELVGLALGKVFHAIFEAGLGDRSLEVLQG